MNRGVGDGEMQLSPAVNPDTQGSKVSLICREDS